MTVPCADAWLGFELLLRDVPLLRRLIAESSGRPAHFTWCLRADPQIEVAYGSARWGIEHYRDVLDQLLAAGDEIGLHPHSFRWDADDHSWISDHADSAWVGHCATVALQSYAEAFGHPCRVYRHGDRFWSEELWTLMADAGVAVDLTAEPGMPAVAGLAPWERSTGRIPHLPSYRHAPFRVGGRSSTLVTLPLTTVDTTGGGNETLVPWLESERFVRGLQTRLTDPQLTHLAFAIRTDLRTLRGEFRRFVANLGMLARLDNTAFMTATAALAIAQPRLVAG